MEKDVIVTAKVPEKISKIESKTKISKKQKVKPEGASDHESNSATLNSRADNQYGIKGKEDPMQKAQLMNCSGKYPAIQKSKLKKGKQEHAPRMANIIQLLPRQGL